MTAPLSDEEIARLERINSKWRPRGHRNGHHRRDNGHRVAPSIAPSDDLARIKAWAEKGVADELASLEAAPQGTRNSVLNNCALRCLRLILLLESLGLPAMSHEELRRELIAACDRNGLNANDGLHNTEATISSAFRAADREGPADAPEPKVFAPNVSVDESLATSPRDAAAWVPHSSRSAAERADALARVRAIFRTWLGSDYDTDALDLLLSTLAVERLDGDPLWILLVSGSGNAKTETVQSANDLAHAHVVSTIASPGALLSATSKRDRAADASGGLLRVIGEDGVLVIKDVTSILSMSRELRGEVLAALREIYDGRWTRTVGTDGGRTLEWTGRIGVIGAVTTAWDTAHSVVSAMGDRFVLLRLDSAGPSRVAAGRQAIGNTGREVAMREQLATAVAAVLVELDVTVAPVTDAETETLLAAADLVTRARTAVEFDYRGDVIDAHAPEMPTRFAKQLSQVVRGGVAVGMTRDAAMRLALRCARDSMPPLRLSILDYLAGHWLSTTGDVRKGVNKPRTTVDRQLQALHMLDLVTCDEDRSTDSRIAWRYSLAAGVDPRVLKVPEPEQMSPEMSVGR